MPTQEIAWDAAVEQAMEYERGRLGGMAIPFGVVADETSWWGGETSRWHGVVNCYREEDLKAARYNTIPTPRTK